MIALAGRALAALVSLPSHLAHLERRMDRIMSAIDDLAAQVAANTTVIGSAKTLIQGLAQQLAAAGTDPAKLQALQTQLQQSDNDLAAAIAANTASAPDPAPSPAPGTPSA